MRQIIFVLTITIFAFPSGANENARILKMAAAGSLEALNQAFNLRERSSAAAAEEIDTALGESIRHNPKNFLIALKKNRSKVRSIDSVLGNLSHDLDDDLKSQKIELKRRLDAIRSVKDLSLRALREKCEVELKREIANMPSE